MIGIVIQRAYSLKRGMGESLLKEIEAIWIHYRFLHITPNIWYQITAHGHEARLGGKEK